MQSRCHETNMVIDSIMIDFVIFESTGELKLYQMKTGIAIAPYFPKFYIDENKSPIPVREGFFPLIPDTAIIILN